MVFALRKGLELGYRRFILLGGVGGRLEHTLGNLQLLDWFSTDTWAGSPRNWLLTPRGKSPVRTLRSRGYFRALSGLPEAGPG